MIKFVSVRVALIFWITGMERKPGRAEKKPNYHLIPTCLKCTRRTQAYILNTCLIMCSKHQANGERKKYI